MKGWLAFVVLLLLTGCGPSFSPVLMSQCDDMMLPSGLGGVPVVGGKANPAGKAKWGGRILLVTTPRTPMEHSRVHPAMKLLEDNLRAHSDEEVTAVGFVQEIALSIAGTPGGRGALVVTVVDWKSKTNLGTWSIKEWRTYPEAKDFEAAYPELLKKLKALHR